MLGRGLESLIPQKNPNNRPENNKANDNDSPENHSEADLSKKDINGNASGQSTKQAKEPLIIAKEEEKVLEPKKDEILLEDERRHIGKNNENPAVFQIEVDRIKPNPHQPRRDFTEESLRELALSIREFGIIQPLIVTKVVKDGENGTIVEYELIAGERRLRAAKSAGLRTVPVIIRNSSEDLEKFELAIIENIQRADLNPIESARAFARLQDEFRMTQREIAARLGKSREVVANSIRLLNLPSEIQDAVSTGKVGESQARLLLSIEDIPSQRKFFQEILQNNLSVREIRSRVKKINTPEGEESSVGQTERRIDPEIFALKDQLEEFFGTKIDVKKEGEKGAITINFYSAEEFKNILGKLFKQNGNQSL